MESEGGDEVFVEGGVGEEGKDVFEEDAWGGKVGELDSIDIDQPPSVSLTGEAVEVHAEDLDGIKGFIC